MVDIITNTNNNTSVKKLWDTKQDNSDDNQKNIFDYDNKLSETNKTNLILPSSSTSKTTKDEINAREKLERAKLKARLILAQSHDITHLASSKEFAQLRFDSTLATSSSDSAGLTLDDIMDRTEDQLVSFIISKAEDLRKSNEEKAKKEEKDSKKEKDRYSTTNEYVA